MTSPHLPARRVRLSEHGKIWWTGWLARWVQLLLDRGVDDTDTLSEVTQTMLDRQHAVVNDMLPDGCVLAAGSNIIIGPAGTDLECGDVDALMHQAWDQLATEEARADG